MNKIIKRIFIGVSIALICTFINKKVVNAKDVLSHSIGQQIVSVSNLDSALSYQINGAFYNRGTGTVNFSFSLYKVAGDSTAPNVMAREVNLQDSTGTYQCSLGSVSLTNSTFGGTAYSVSCPVNFTNTSLQKVNIYLMDNQQNSLSTYRFITNGLFTFVGDKDVNVSLDTSSTTNAVNNQTTSIINNQNSNTQSIINNQDSNTQDIMNNQDSNTQDIIKNQNDNANNCGDYNYDISSFKYSKQKAYLNINGSAVNNNSWNITDYIFLSKNENYTFSSNISMGSTASYCVYDKSDKSLINCYNYENSTSLTISPPDDCYLKLSVHVSSQTSFFKLTGHYCKNRIDSMTDAQNETNDLIKSDDVSGGTSTGSGFFDEFDVGVAGGLTGIITSPLRLINSLLDSTCSPLVLPLPFVNQNVTLPCMSTIYRTHFSTFLQLYQLITTGLIGYWVCVKIFQKVKGFQDPQDDKVEVLDL